MSTILFHGPASRDMALKEADVLGRLLAPPLGDDGLKVDVAREVVEVLSAVPVGDDLGVIVIGPFESATPEAADALLKTLEDFDPRFVRPLLWSLDMGDIPPTIRSRCLAVWCPTKEGASPEASYMPAARALCEAALARRTAALIEHLAEQKGAELEIMMAAAQVLVTQEEWSLKGRLILWSSIRETLRTHRNPSSLATLAAFLV